MEKFTDFTLKQYLDQLAGDAPVPGGGSVSAYVASLAMGLTQMVGRISLKRKLKSDLTPEALQVEKEKRARMQEIVDSIEKTKADAFQIVDLDPQIYHKVMGAWKKGGEEMESALNDSFRLQADLALLIVMAKEWNIHMADLVTGSIKNDLLVSASLYEAAFRGAYHTAMINVKYLENAKAKDHAEKALSELKYRFEKSV